MNSYGASLTGFLTSKSALELRDDKDFSACAMGYAAGEELIPLGRLENESAILDFAKEKELLPFGKIDNEKYANRFDTEVLKTAITKFNSNMFQHTSPKELSCTGGKMMIEEGTTIKTDSWSHTVTQKDKNIKIRNKNEKTVTYFEVVKKNPLPKYFNITDFTILLDKKFSWTSVNHIPAYFTHFNISTSKTRGERVCIDAEESIAVDTLRDMITESDFRKFLRFGFILVNAPSGKVYQIFRTASHTRVWRGGKVIEEICVRIKNKKIPLTDNLVAFKTMIEGDEEEFRRIGNVYKLEKVA